MIHESKILEHMEVIGSDGGHVGKVDRVIAGDIELAKFDFGAGLRHHLIPMIWASEILDNKICLSLTKDAAKAAWREKV